MTLVAEKSVAEKPVVIKSSFLNEIIAQVAAKPGEAIVITPKMARGLVAVHNTSNRPVRGTKVEDNATAMRDGKWQLNGETIKFDRNGKLLDGQHRLLGCVKADVSFTTYVVTDLETSSFTTIDIGTIRTPADMLHVAGNTEFARNAASSIRFILAYHNLLNGKAMLLNHFREEQVVSFWRENQEAIDTFSRAYKDLKPAIRRMLPAPAFIPVLFMAWTSGHSLESLEDFIAKINTGIGLEDGHPILMLRDKLTERSTSRAKINNVDILIWVIRAFNAFIEGRTLRIIYGALTSHGISYPRIVNPLTKS